MYDELEQEGWVILAVSQDVAGAEVAAQHYAEQGVEFPALLDPTHSVTRLYGMVNVPSGVWIDEEGRIVRPPETAWSREYRFGPMTVGGDAYLAALRDWVAQGAESEYAMGAEELALHLAPRHAERALADASFVLGTHLFRAGELQAALPWWARAQELDPDNWNYHRDPWSLDGRPAGPRFLEKLGRLGERPYYEPPHLP